MPITIISGACQSSSNLPYKRNLPCMSLSSNHICSSPSIPHYKKSHFNTKGKRSRCRLRSNLQDTIDSYPENHQHQYRHWNSDKQQTKQPCQRIKEHNTTFSKKKKKNHIDSLIVSQTESSVITEEKKKTDISVSETTTLHISPLCRTDNGTSNLRAHIISNDIHKLIEPHMDVSAFPLSTCDSPIITEKTDVLQAHSIDSDMSLTTDPIHTDFSTPIKQKTMPPMTLQQNDDYVSQLNELCSASYCFIKKKDVQLPCPKTTKTFNDTVLPQYSIDQMYVLGLPGLMEQYDALYQYKTSTQSALSKSDVMQQQQQENEQNKHRCTIDVSYMHRHKRYKTKENSQINVILSSLCQPETEWLQRRLKPTNNCMFHSTVIHSQNTGASFLFNNLIQHDPKVTQLTHCEHNMYPLIISQHSRHISALLINHCMNELIHVSHNHIGFFLNHLKHNPPYCFCKLMTCHSTFDFQLLTDNPLQPNQTSSIKLYVIVVKELQQQQRSVNTSLYTHILLQDTTDNHHSSAIHLIVDYIHLIVPIQYVSVPLVYSSTHSTQRDLYPSIQGLTDITHRTMFNTINNDPTTYNLCTSINHTLIKRSSTLSDVGIVQKDVSERLWTLLFNVPFILQQLITPNGQSSDDVHKYDILSQSHIYYVYNLENLQTHVNYTRQTVLLNTFGHYISLNALLKQDDVTYGISSSDVTTDHKNTHIQYESLLNFNWWEFPFNKCLTDHIQWDLILTDTGYLFWVNWNQGIIRNTDPLSRMAQSHSLTLHKRSLYSLSSISSCIHCYRYNENCPKIKLCHLMTLFQLPYTLINEHDRELDHWLSIESKTLINTVILTTHLSLHLITSIPEWGLFINEKGDLFYYNCRTELIVLSFDTFCHYQLLNIHTIHPLQSNDTETVPNISVEQSKTTMMSQENMEFNNQSYMTVQQYMDHINVFPNDKTNKSLLQPYEKLLNPRRKQKIINQSLHTPLCSQCPLLLNQCRTEAMTLLICIHSLGLIETDFLNFIIELLGILQFQTLWITNTTDLENSNMFSFVLEHIKELILFIEWLRQLLTIWRHAKKQCDTCPLLHTLTQINNQNLMCLQQLDLMSQSKQLTTQHYRVSHSSDLPSIDHTNHPIQDTRIEEVFLTLFDPSVPIPIHDDFNSHPSLLQLPIQLHIKQFFHSLLMKYYKQQIIIDNNKYHIHLLYHIDPNHNSQKQELNNKLLHIYTHVFNSLHQFKYYDLVIQRQPSCHTFVDYVLWNDPSKKSQLYEIQCLDISRLMSPQLNHEMLYILKNKLNHSDQLQSTKKTLISHLVRHISRLMYLSQQQTCCSQQLVFQLWHVYQQACLNYCVLSRFNNSLLNIKVHD